MPLPMIQENAPLASLTTLGIGGPARFLLEAAQESDIPDALEFARQRACPVFVLGGGSNVLISDTGYPGLVVRIGLRGIEGLASACEAPVTAAAGEPWDDFVDACVQGGLAGIECLSGIPGTVGGTPVQNVGAYGQEVSDVIVSVRVFDTQTGRFREIDRAGCAFRYRSSIFNTTHPGRYVVVAVRFRLQDNGTPHLAYPDLVRWSGSRTHPVSLVETRDAVIQIRAAKAMVLLPGDPDSRSAGSFFKNPVVSPERFQAAAEAARLRGHDGTLPGYAVAGGGIKIPAAWLIEHAGFRKGYRRGRAAISTRHTLALVNLGGATAGEILDLAREIRAGVCEAFRIELIPEPVFVGFEASGSSRAINALPRSSVE